MEEYKDISEEERYKLELIKKIVKENEEKINSPEYIAECKRINEMCEIIKRMPMNTLEEIQTAKEASRSIPHSHEKVLLFYFILYYEERLKWPCIKIGTEVKVKKNLEVDKWYGSVMFQDDMMNLLGKKAIITGVNESYNGGAPYAYCLNHKYYFSQEMFNIL